MRTARTLRLTYISVAIAINLAATPMLAAATSDCPPLLIPHQRALFAAESNTVASVSWQMQPGRLQPQLEALLAEHMHIEHVVWQVSAQHQWPSHYELRAVDWHDAIERLLQPYQLRIQLYSNRTAVIDYLPASRGVL
jgi:hypothetical protein